ncbi:MAG TPA: toll/interleukin-1 receptor domain-containing protein [Steroidobacteraceae bacterium]|nr:toll/interleukin-1 receptor domain-containing protein [Steroidobacteraceae bacterium]
MSSAKKESGVATRPGSTRSPLQPQPPWVSHSVLGPHVGATDYLLAGSHGATAVEIPRSYRDNESLWKDLIYSGLTAGMLIHLDRFLLLNWVPRAPGQFYTMEGDRARQEALYYIHHRECESPARDHAHTPLPQRSPDYTMVFTPIGKVSMLQGGIGAIRLKPIRIAEESHWLMTASSDGVVHCGIPLAIPRRLYVPLFAELENQGALCVSIRGELEFVPDPFSRLYDQAVLVPKLYLRVTDIERAEPAGASPEVSVAVSFASSFEGEPKVYASYVTFEPDKAGRFESAIDWMKREYVEGEYQGRILTDFDQTRTIFPEARVALARIMDRTMTRSDLAETINLMHAQGTVEQYFDTLDLHALLPVQANSKRTKIFISYAHAAEAATGWVKRLRTHLNALNLEVQLEIWDDSRILPGERWHNEIRTAIEQSRIAVLVLTADFLASRYIRESELPLLLQDADADGTTILCVYGSHVHLSGGSARLRDYQSVNAEERPLQGMTENERDRVFVELARRVEQILTQN